MKEKVIERLGAVGYTVMDEDKPLICILINRVSQKIKNDCNVDDVPDGLIHVAVDMVIGEFLLIKRSTGGLDGFDVAHAVSAIKQGDTNVSFAVGGDTITFDGLVDHLINGGRSQLSAFRRLRW